MNTFTEEYDINGDITLEEFIDTLPINPVCYSKTEGGNGQSYNITFKSYNDCLLFTREYFGGDISDTEIQELMGW